MAKLVLINEITYREDINEIDDIVAVVDDKHIFDENEYVKFNIVETPMTATEISDLQKAATPEMKRIYRSKTLEWTDKEPENKIVWQSGIDWCELVDEPKYKTSYNTITKSISHTLDRKIENLVPISMSISEVK